MTKLLFLWLFAYAFVWWLLWFLVLPLRARGLAPSSAKEAEEGDRSARMLWRKALVVSAAATLLTTLLVAMIAQTR